MTAANHTRMRTRGKYSETKMNRGPILTLIASAGGPLARPSSACVRAREGLTRGPPVNYTTDQSDCYDFTVQCNMPCLHHF